MYELAELHRRIENLVLFGSIAELDSSKRLVRVRLDHADEGHITAWLPWPADIGRNYIRWRPLRVDCQVVLGCPSGVINNGQILGMLYSAEQQSDSDLEGLDVIEFDDGTRISYDSDNQHLSAELQSGTAYIKAPDKISLDTAQLHVLGDINADGDIKAAGDVADKKRSMAADRTISNKHKHAVSGHSVATPAADW